MRPSYDDPTQTTKTHPNHPNHPNRIYSVLRAPWRRLGKQELAGVWVQPNLQLWHVRGVQQCRGHELLESGRVHAVGAGGQHCVVHGVQRAAAAARRSLAGLLAVPLGGCARPGKGQGSGGRARGGRTSTSTSTHTRTSTRTTRRQQVAFWQHATQQQRRCRRRGVPLVACVLHVRCVCIRRLPPVQSVQAQQEEPSLRALLGRVVAVLASLHPGKVLVNSRGAQQGGGSPRVGTCVQSLLIAV